MQTISAGQLPEQEDAALLARGAPGTHRTPARVLSTLRVGILATLGLFPALALASPDLPPHDHAHAHSAPVRVIESAPEQVKWLDMASSPFVEAGRQADGGLDVGKMLEAWRDAGMSPSDGKQAFLQVLRLRPVLMGRSDPLAEMEHLADAAAASSQLAHRHPDVLKNLESGATPGQEDFSDTMLWAMLISNIKKSEADSVKVDGAGMVSVPSGISMDQAKVMLEKAVRDTGLRSFVPSMWQLQSPQSLAQAAVHLQQANKELGKITGWSGKVLGLDGRVELSMGPVYETSPGLAALVLTDESGRLQMISGWSDMAHEWFHVFDFVASRYSLQSPQLIALTHSVDQAHRESQIPLSAKRLVQALDDSHEWKQRMADFDEGNEVAYFNTNMELGAFAFSVFANDHGANLLQSKVDARALPSDEEAMGHREYFTALFNASAKLGLAGQSTPAIPVQMNVAAWRGDRQAGSDHLLAQRRPTVR